MAGLDAGPKLPQSALVANYTCIECGGEVDIDVTHIGPWAARGLASPARIICFPCAERLALPSHREGPHVWVIRGGEEFRPYRGALARTDNPDFVGMYTHDEKRAE
jgi:hypothetical protein